MKSARLEWCLNELESAKALLVEGIKQYPDFDKFYMMWGQIDIQQQQFDEARKIFQEGTRKCPHSINLWLLLVRLEESPGGKGASKARSTLDMAKVKNPKNDLLWLEHVRIDLRADNKPLVSNADHYIWLWLSVVSSEAHFRRRPTLRELCRSVRTRAYFGPKRSSSRINTGGRRNRSTPSRSASTIHM